MRGGKGAPAVQRPPRPHPRSACDAPPPAGAAGAGTGRGVRLGGTWKNHPDCIAVGEAARRSRFPGAASPRGVRGARFPGAWICLGREVPPGGDAGLGYVVAHARQIERSRRLRGGPTPGGRRWLRKWLQPLGKSCVARPLWPLVLGLIICVVRLDQPRTLFSARLSGIPRRCPCENPIPEPPLFRNSSSCLRKSDPRVLRFFI